MNERLRTIDFVNGVRSEDIQHNFNEVDSAMNRERLRTAGWGLVEGFALSVLDGFKVKVGAGVMVNKLGEEREVAEQVLNIELPDCMSITETCDVDSEGNFTLKFFPFLTKKNGWIVNDYYQANYPMDEEFLIVDADIPTTKIKALHANHNLVTIDAVRFAGKKVKVTYLYTNNRLDSILLDKNGECSIKKGITSSSPSSVDYGDYENFYSVGLTEVLIGDTAKIETFETPRDYRRVYVDEKNVLYLNGKPYKEAQIIHFAEPVPPYENALWYDSSTNCLMIWRIVDGNWGWEVVNETLQVAKREKKIWTPDKCPADCQTFLFAEDEVNLRYIPGNNELEIIVDNAPLMSDQWDEVIMEDADKPYLATGIGFKLKTPLDRATYVECRVLHSVQLQPLRATFQRAAIFVNENYVFQETLNTEQIFNTEEAYVIGENQLEVFVDGLRLNKTLEYIEMIDAATPAVAGDKGKASTAYKVIRPLTAGQKVAYRISRIVWSYDNLNAMVEEIEKKADDAVKKSEDVETSLSNMNVNVNNNFAAMNTVIGDLTTKVNGMNNYVKKSDMLTASNMAVDIRKAMKAGVINHVAVADAIVQIPSAQETDFITVFYMDGTTAKPLVRDTEFTATNNGDNLDICIESSLVSSSSSVYIMGIHFGI